MHWLIAIPFTAHVNGHLTRHCSTALWWYVNLNTVGPDTLTVSADANVTITGTATVATVAARVCVITATATPVSIIGLSYVNGVVTLTTNSPHGLAAGGNAIVANLSNAGFNGTFVISTVPNAYQLTYPLTTAVAFGGATPNAVIPSVGAQTPGLINTVAKFTVASQFGFITASAA